MSFIVKPEFFHENKKNLLGELQVFFSSFFVPCTCFKIKFFLGCTKCHQVIYILLSSVSNGMRKGRSWLRSNIFERSNMRILFPRSQTRIEVFSQVTYEHWNYKFYKNKIFWLFNCCCHSSISFLYAIVIWVINIFCSSSFLSCHFFLFLLNVNIWAFLELRSIEWLLPICVYIHSTILLSLAVMSLFCHYGTI